ncbi:MAG: hypothetical protein H6922_00225 [Pseudomonadaceae bacterium]|nr:hypothetical protein [Pseudomonadaceae bacterium]
MKIIGARNYVLPDGRSVHGTEAIRMVTSGLVSAEDLRPLGGFDEARFMAAMAEAQARAADAPPPRTSRHHGERI